ncbi:MAG: hypothetical protein ACRC1L_04020 [Prochlorococcaceae cyanobacterium]
MAEAPYLIALAFLEQNGKRALPLAGKSFAAAAGNDNSDDPGEDGRALALELLLRVWQRSDGGALRRAAGGASLLLLVMPLDVMNEQLPVLKATWLAGGDTEATLQQLQSLASQSWQVSVAKYEPVTFSPQTSAATALS